MSGGERCHGEKKSKQLLNIKVAQGYPLLATQEINFNEQHEYVLDSLVAGRGEYTEQYTDRKEYSGDI